MRATSLGVAAVALSLGLGSLSPTPAAAQSAACVNLLVGAGYAAWMGVRYDGKYHWSSSFPIGQHRCIELPVEGMSEGDTYGVVVSAVLGSSKVECTPTPSPFDPNNTNSVTYNAWGTTLNVHCAMPSATTSAVQDAMTATPDQQGMRALEQYMREGDQPPPSE
jgi:hypothetical protein